MINDGSGELLRVKVGALLDGVRVDRAVAMVAGVSRSLAGSLVADGHVTVRGLPVVSRHRLLMAGETLEIVSGAIERRRPLLPDPDVSFGIVHVDPDVVVVDKPAGLVVHPGAGHVSPTLAGGLLARFPDLEGLSVSGVCDPDRPGMVHRLDRGTSGLLAVARTEAAYRALRSQMAARSVERAYLALVVGVPRDERGVIDAPIGRSVREPTRMSVSGLGRSARTHFRVLARYEKPISSALLAVTLETGRTHQIRVHMAAIGHPVVGDDRYGRRRRSAWAGLLADGRLFLHAGRLGITHPSTGEPMTWRSALPIDLAGIVEPLPSLPAPDGDPGGNGAR